MKKYLHLGLILAFCLAFTLSGCGGGGGSSTPTNGTISGRVLDTYNSRNYPVIGAVIAVGSVTAKTGDDGSYTMQIAPGTYTVTMSASQYNAQTNSSIIVRSSETTTVDFSTTPATVPTPILFGENGTGTSGLNSPRDMYEGTDNLIYIVDQGNNRIQVLNPTGSGQFVSYYGTNGSGAGQFNIPNSIVLDNAGNIYVSDGSNHRIQKVIPGTVPTYQVWNCNGGSAPNPAWYPRGIAWGPQNQLYVVSPWFNGTSGPTLAIYNSNGTFVSKMDLPGGTNAVGLAIDINRNKMYIGDFTNGPGIAGKVLVYNYSGGTWTQGTDITYPANAPLPNNFGVVEGLWVDPNGYLWVADSKMNNDRVVKFDPSGHWIMTVSTGSNSAPKGVLIDHNGYLCVSGKESGGGAFRIQYFQF